MPLHLIQGPPNSGRTDEVQRRYLDLLPRRPVLVVPGVDDVFGWERRLTRERGALVGGQILHFKDLHSEILRAAGSERKPVASDLHRIHLVRRAIDERWGEVADRLDDQPGMALALLELIDDFRAENMDPTTVGERASEHGRHLGPLTAVYQRYLELLEETGLTDLPAEAKAAVAISDRVWSRRPVMVAGFDEMTRQQLDLVRRLAFGAGVEVTVAVTHEPDNPALDLTATLVSQLRELGPPDQISEERTSRDGSAPHAATLAKVQDLFLRDGASPGLVGDEDGTVTVLRSAGRRNEAEAIGGEIARLVAEGVDLAEIAIAVEAPSRNGAVLAETLERYRIPASVEAETSVATTVTGNAVLNVLEAFETGSAEALIGFLRSPGGPPAESVDVAEFRCRTASRSAIDVMRDGDLQVKVWDRLKEGDEPSEVVVDLVREINRAILDRAEGPGTRDRFDVETRAAEAIARACEEIKALVSPAGQPAAIRRAIRTGAVKVWAVPRLGTVKIASPYSLRAKRVEHLFCAGLQEAPLADTDKAGPFLSAQDRAALGMSERRDPEVQQRYLFYSSLTVPTRGLYLSCRISDETGAAEHPSPLIGAVEDLFARDEEGRVRVGSGGKLGSDVLFLPAEAPTVEELARSLASSGSPVDVAGRVPGLDPREARLVDDRIAAAREAEERTRCLRDLDPNRVPRLDPEPEFAATELEAYASCPYRWFIERRLRPRPFEPDPDHLSMGTLVHDALEAVYREGPGPIPRPDNLDRWLELVPAVVEEKAGAVGLGSTSVSAAALRRRAVLLIETQLRREAAWEDAAHLPWRLEVGIGTRDSEIPAVGMDGWKLKGKIDRIDLSPETTTDVPREAVVIDYKTGTVDSHSHHKAAKERRVQVQLYLHAIREIWGLHPVAGIYIPVRLGGEKGRGAFEDNERMRAEMKQRGVSERDRVDDLEEFIAAGIDSANAAAESIRKGILDHDPALCPDHFDHPAVRKVAESPDEEEFVNRSFV